MDGRVISWKTVCRAVRIAVAVRGGSPVLRLRSQRGKSLELTWTRMRWPARKTTLVDLAHVTALQEHVMPAGDGERRRLVAVVLARDRGTVGRGGVGERTLHTEIRHTASRSAHPWARRRTA